MTTNSPARTDASSPLLSASCHGSRTDGAIVVSTPKRELESPKREISPSPAPETKSRSCTPPDCKPLIDNSIPNTDSPPAINSRAGCGGRTSSNGSPNSVPQQFCLRWNNYQSNLTSVFDQLLQTESFVDVTLACDGRSIKAHKMVLSACSPYFQTLFSDTPCQHPIVIMRDVCWSDLKAIVEFMYKGEINVSQEQIGPLLRIAEMLKVRGLADVTNMESKARVGSPKESELPETDELLSYMDPVKKLRLGQDWNFGGATNTSSLELRLSPHRQQQQLLAAAVRNVRKRRWPSADTIFNAPSSPLSGLIAAEREEQEKLRERERDRDLMKEQERRREHDSSLMTPPAASAAPTSSTGTKLSSSGGSTHSVSTTRRHTPSVLESAIHALEMPSPASTPAPGSTNAAVAAAAAALMGSSRVPSVRSLTPGPQLGSGQTHQQQPSQHGHMHAHHLQPHGHASQSHSHQISHSQRSSPSSSTSGASAHQPSNIISGGGPLTPSSIASDARFPLGSAAMAAAAAAQIDFSGLGMPPHGGPMHGVPTSGSVVETARLPPPHHPGAPSTSSASLSDDLEIKPGIAEMIREEERAKILENSHASWMGTSGSSLADSYQYQLQSMWQKCWNTNQNLMHHLRFRERGPLKSWRPETMAEAIFSVLKEGLSLSQAARKYDIPYPTFVLYANRVHNMLGPSIDGGPDLRPKGRGRPQRILLGIWPDEHIKGVIKTVVFRDAKDLKEEALAHMPPYGRHSPVFPFQEMPLNYPGPIGPVHGSAGPGGSCPNGMPTPTGDQMSQEATAAAVAAVAHNIRQQMQLAAAAQQHQQQQHQHGTESLFNLPPHMQTHAGPGGIPLPKGSISPALSSGSNPATAGGPLLGPRHAPSPCGPGGMPGLSNMPPSMAVALGRCDPATLLSQQQQHQLQQLHMQQQHALHQQQQKTAFGISSMPLPSTAATPSASVSSTALSAQHSSMADKPKALSASPMRSETPRLHTPLAELGLEMSYKREYSPTRFFTEDLAELVGVSSSPAATTPSTSAVTSTSVSMSAPIPSSGGGGGSGDISSSSGSSIKMEPITTNNE